MDKETGEDKRDLQYRYKANDVGEAIGFVVTMGMLGVAAIVTIAMIVKIMVAP